MGKVCNIPLLIQGVFIPSKLQCAMYCTEKTEAAIWPLANKEGKNFCSVSVILCRTSQEPEQKIGFLTERAN